MRRAWIAVIAATLLALTSAAFVAEQFNPEATAGEEIISIRLPSSRAVRILNKVRVTAFDQQAFQVLVSGRPMIISDVIEYADAFVAAWLPGTEAQGVADVLFVDYAPTGKLSFSWPRSMSQIPINVGDENYDPLFEYGFGLTY